MGNALLLFVVRSHGAGGPLLGAIPLQARCDTAGSHRECLLTFIPCYR